MNETKNQSMERWVQYSEKQDQFHVSCDGIESNFYFNLVDKPLTHRGATDLCYSLDHDGGERTVHSLRQRARLLTL